VDPIRDSVNWFAYVNNDPVNWVDPWGLWPQKTQDVIDAHKDEKYQAGTNDCDVWVEKILKEAEVSLPDSWSSAANTTVSTHIKEMTDVIQSVPNEGTNIVFHGGNHALLINVNTDKSVDVAHISSKPGKVATEHHANVGAFEKDWGKDKGKTFDYVPVDTPPVSKPDNKTAAETVSASANAGNEKGD
jgi:hypothetical protein